MPVKNIAIDTNTDVWFYPLILTAKYSWNVSVGP